jgi:hypothetical protein
MSTANELIPRTSPPEDNLQLTNEGQLGVVVDEMVFPVTDVKSVVKESLKCRADRLLDWMRWRLIIDGHFEVTYAESGPRVVGDYEIEVGDWKTLASWLEADRFASWRFYTTRHTQRLHLEAKERLNLPLIEITDGKLFIVDSGYTPLDSHGFKQFIPDEVIVLVKGVDPVGRMFSTGRQEEEDIGSLEREYVRLSETVLPELTAPERILICRF